MVMVTSYTGWSVEHHSRVQSATFQNMTAQIVAKEVAQLGRPHRLTPAEIHYKLHDTPP